MSVVGLCWKLFSKVGPPSSAAIISADLVKSLKGIVHTKLKFGQ